MNTMEKSCPDIGILAGWLEGTLGPQERSRMASHLASCDECRRAVAIASTLEAPPATGAVNEILLSKVVSSSRRRRLVPLAAVAAAVLAVAVGFSVFPRHRAQPAPVAKAVEAQPAPVVVAPPADPRPVAVETPKPVIPAPVVPPPVEPPKPVATTETPKPPAPAPVVDKPVPQPTVVDPAPVVVEKPAPSVPKIDVLALAPVFVIDPAGDLWLRRDQAETKALALEKAGEKDRFEARAGGASFSLEARTSVMLEKGAEAAFSHVKGDDIYGLALEQGLVMLDTEGSSQKWRISFGNSKLDFNNLNGRLAVESRGDRMSALLLDGSAELKIGALAKKAQIGQEVVFSREGTVVEQKVETQKKLARLDELRPKVFTAFSSTFDEKNDEFQPYPYAVVTGKRALGPTGFFLQADSIPAAKAGEKNGLASEIHLDRPFGVVSGMVLHFKYRTTLPVFSVKIGKYSADYTSRSKAGQWAEGEIPLGLFSFEGTPMLPTDPVENVRFAGPVDRKNAQLDVDGVQFLRRVR